MSGDEGEPAPGAIWWLATFTLAALAGLAFLRSLP